MRILLSCVFMLVFGIAGAQQMRFSHLDQKQGLSQNTPGCFLQDKEGFMWVGTQDGLNRYDGYSFKVYRSVAGDTNSLYDNFVTKLAEDNDGNIWVGTRGGLCVYVKRDDKFYRFHSPYDHPNEFHDAVRGVSALNEGGILYWSQFNRLLSVGFNATTKQIVETGIVNEEAVLAFSYSPQSGDLAYVRKGSIAIGLPGNPTVQYTMQFSSRTARTVLLDGEHLYLIDSIYLLHIPVHSQGMSETIYTSDVQLLNMEVDANHAIWLATSNGLRVINNPLTTPYVWTATEVKEDYFSLRGNRIESIYRTDEGIMWIGTVGGINIYDPLQTRFSLLKGAAREIAHETIWFVMTAGSTTLWANETGLIYVSQGNSPKWLQAIPQNLPYTAGAFDSKGRLWLGTKNHGVIMIDTLRATADHRFLQHADLLGSAVMDFCSIDGNLWIASIGSLCVVNENDLSIQTLHSRKFGPKQIPTNYFSAVESSKDGLIYVGTAKGIAVFENPDTNATWIVNDPANANSLAYNIVNDLRIIDSALWIATMGYGLDKFNLQTRTFTHYSTSNGLANNTIYGIEQGMNNELWLSSNEGMILLNTVSGTSRNFTMRDGLPSNEFVINKHCAAQDGRLYFGSSNGLISFAPSDFASEQSAVRPVLTQLQINYKERNLYMDSLLLLSPDERNISFEFAAIDYRNQDKISYAYILEGFDTVWHETAASNRVANYTNVPYGKYTFKVRYRVSGEQWSSNMLEYPVFIETPFYATTWFRVLVTLTGVIVVALIVRYVSQRKLRKQLEVLRVQEQIRTEKERISRDLHDNVGAQLTYVISSLDNLSYALHKKSINTESEKLEQLGEFARGTMDQLRESIWAINSEQIRLSELAARWKNYLSQLAETRHDFSSQVIVAGEDLLLKPSVAIEVHRIVQEAIANAFRHSKGNSIHVEVDVKNQRPSVSVIDNGVGMNENPAKDGHYGLSNMKERAKRINGNLSFHSGPLGTTVHFHWPHN